MNLTPRLLRHRGCFRLVDVSVKRGSGHVLIQHCFNHNGHVNDGALPRNALPSNALSNHVPSRHDTVRGLSKHPLYLTENKGQSTYVKDTEIQQQYGLTEKELEGIPFKTLRNAYEHEENMYPSARFERRLYPRDLIVQRSLKKYRTRLNVMKQGRKQRQGNEAEEDITDALSSLVRILYNENKSLKNDKKNTSWHANQVHRRNHIISSLKVVTFSIATNVCVAVAKFGSYAYTGSASMLSEAIHSVIDTMNQLFLAFGLIYSLKRPHSDHPYGFDKARYVYALISGVSIFEIGAVFTIKHGVSQLYHPSLVLDHSLGVAYAVLLFTAFFEGWSLMFAYKQAKIQSKMEGVSFSHYIFKGYEPNTIAVLAEDIAATVGVLIAGAGIGLSAYTGNPVYDALGSIGVGTLLGGMAIFIIIRNKDALIGRAMDQAKQRTIVDMLERDPSVLSVNDVKTMVEGPSYVRFKAEIFFDTDNVTKKYMDTIDPTSLLKEARGLGSEADLDLFMKEQCKQLVDTLALEVDRLESLIKRKYPEIRHVDLELL